MTKNHYFLFHPCTMTQSSLKTFFTAATPDQIAKNNEKMWAALCNEHKTKQAFQQVSAELHAEEIAERQCKSSVKQSCKY